MIFALLFSFFVLKSNQIKYITFARRQQLSWVFRYCCQNRMNLCAHMLQHLMHATFVSFVHLFDVIYVHLVGDGLSYVLHLPDLVSYIFKFNLSFDLFFFSSILIILLLLYQFHLCTYKVVRLCAKKHGDYRTTMIGNNFFSVFHLNAAYQFCVHIGYIMDMFNLISD